VVEIYDATGPQKREIARLSAALGESEPIEEKQMTSGEAGRLVRQLYARLKARGKVRRVKVLETTNRPEAFLRLASLRSLGRRATIKHSKATGIFRVYELRS